MSVSQNLKDLQIAIEHAAQDAGRDAGDVDLVAVSKKQPESRIDEALEAGQRVFGENRVQEAQARWMERRLHA